MFVSHFRVLRIRSSIIIPCIFILSPWWNNTAVISHSLHLFRATFLRYKPLVYYFSQILIQNIPPSPCLRNIQLDSTHHLDKITRWSEEDNHRNELSSRVRRFVYPGPRFWLFPRVSLFPPRLGLQLRAAAATLSPLATGNAGPDVKYDARSNFNYAMQQPWIVATGSFRHIGLIHVIRATLIKPGNAVSLNPPVECKMSLAR